MNLSGVEKIKAMQVVREEERVAYANDEPARQKKREAAFEPILRAHNELVEAGAYVKVDARHYRLQSLKPCTTLVVYTLGEPVIVFEEEFRVSAEGEFPLEFYCNYKPLDEQLDGFKFFGRHAEEWETYATNLYLSLMSYVIVFEPRTTKMPFWKRMITQK